MKSWGIKITLLYLGFVALIVTMVTMAMRQKVDLVSKEYYAREIHFQEQIDKSNRSNALVEQVSYTLNDAFITIHFPGNGSVTGTILLYHPETKEKDVVKSFKTDDTHSFRISRKELSTGRYEMQIDWQLNGVSYYDNFILNLQR